MLFRQSRSWNNDGLENISINSHSLPFILFNAFVYICVPGLMFEIAEGGFLDIDVHITDPEGTVIYQGERETSGKYTFSAQKTGVYTYCFGNKMSTMTPKVTYFNLRRGQ